MARTASDLSVIERPLFELAEPVGGWGAPWPAAFEVATALEPSSWTLVGGLMVQLHAHLARVTPPRSTQDVDAALHLESGVHTYPAAAAALQGIGYEPDLDTKYAYRFRRGNDIVDLMAADHLAPASRPRFHGRAVLRLGAGTQALRRTVNVDIHTADHRVRLSLPNVHGALVLKAEAHRQDSRHPDRHLQDGIVLLACVDDADAIIQDLEGSDRKRILHLVRQLRERPLVWAGVNADTAALARATLGDLTEALA